MPNHIHGIIEIKRADTGPAPTIGDIICSFKTRTTGYIIKEIKAGKMEIFEKRFWQRNYYEHVIRNEKEYWKIYEYIENNPLNWNKDEYYSKLDNKNKDKFLYSYEAIHMNCKSYDEMLKKLSNKKLSDLIIDRLFKDNYYNVLINIREMFNYNEKLQNSLIEKEYLDIYMLLLNFDSLTNKEKIEFFKKNKDKDLSTKFYEDLRKCKNDAYNSIINSLYVPNNKNELLSNKYGVDIYLLDGDNFDMMIRGLKTPYCENTRLYRECFSLINNDNTSRVNSNYYYGYNNIDYDYIIHVSEGDSFSADMLENGTKKINRIMTSDEINSYCGISEIQIKTNQKNLEPSYLVAFNDINESYVENSKKLGIPIILINEEKYNKRKLKNNNIFSNKNEYIYDSFDEQRYRK